MDPRGCSSMGITIYTPRDEFHLKEKLGITIYTPRTTFANKDYSFHVPVYFLILHSVKCLKLFQVVNERGYLVYVYTFNQV